MCTLKGDRWEIRPGVDALKGDEEATKGITESSKGGRQAFKGNREALEGNANALKNNEAVPKCTNRELKGDGKSRCAIARC